MEKIRILVVDDHPMMREAMLTALNEENDMEVIGEAANGFEALKLAADLNPDVILMDLLMPGMNGLEAVSAICTFNPRAKILVVTSFEDDDKVMAAIQAGALGYFPKTASRTYLLEAIRKIADGLPYLPSGIAAKLFKNLREMKSSPNSVDVKSAVDEPLTSRQEEILVLLGDGRSDYEISNALNIEETTVRSHVHRIIQRIGVENRSQVVAYANRIRKR
ncbi:MAG: response regulator transcription factor [Chloroflexi bacterium]|nr:response regulator transcription factor [Chloroflexota bacterium]